MIKRLNGDILRMTIFTGAVILYLCIELFGLTGLKPVLSVFCILAIILSIYKVSFISKLFSLAFIICGSYLVWEKGMGLHNLENYIMLYGEMIYILTLFVIVLLMPIPIKVGGYREAIETFLNKFITKPSELHMAIMLFSYVLGIFLNLATPALMYASTKDFIDRFPLRNKKSSLQ